MWSIPRHTTTDGYGMYGINGAYNLPAIQQMNINVEGNPVYYQLALGLAGSWGPEAPLRPGVHNLGSKIPFTAIRFRSLSPGLPAVVSGIVK